MDLRFRSFIILGIKFNRIVLHVWFVCFILLLKLINADRRQMLQGRLNYDLFFVYGPKNCL